MNEYAIPLIIRGQVIEDEPVRFEARRGELVFTSPDVKRHIDKIVMKDAGGLADLYALSLDEIVDYLVGLGPRMMPDQNRHIEKALEIGLKTSGHSRELLHAQYRSMAATLNPRTLNEIIDQNIGRENLEQWNRRHLHDRDVLVRAFGSRTVHLNAGNGPAVASYALINGALLRCDNIVKSPSNDPFTAAAMALTMIEYAPDHPITKHMTVAYWKGGDEAFEKKLYRATSIEKIVAWGGSGSMSHIRQHLEPGIDLIALDPKVSVSILGAEAVENEAAMNVAAERLARDVGYFNQEGCLSSRIAYVVSGTDEAGIEKANALGAKVEAAIRTLPATLSSPHPAFDPVLRAEIDGLRFSDEVRLFGCKGNEGGVIVSQEAEPVDFRDRLSGRTVNIVPVDTPQQAAGFVTVHTQTIGVYPAALKPLIADACMMRGSQRLTDLGCATFEGMAAPHDGMEFMRRMVRWGVIEDFDDSAIEGGAGLVHAASEVEAGA